MSSVWLQLRLVRQTCQQWSMNGLFLCWKRFRLMDRLAKLEASKHRYVDKFDVINICSKESQEHQSIDDWKQGENFQDNTMEIQVEAAGQGEFKEEVCKPELLASVVDIKVESGEIFHPMMTLVSCPLIESPFSKGGKSLTDQSAFLQLIDFIRFGREAEDESICLHADSDFQECYYNSNLRESSSSQLGRIDEDIFVKPIRVYKRKRWKRELLISFLIYLIVPRFSKFSRFH
ncbi:hypothetical protein PRUPE_1G014200 [Prunus persica]|uniref:Uncharacterized protein n=1 Tax=Prunus persica TaxID=3760 RepID=A0A251QR86_PRUPE|nr:hypothetical protein PRUPE_1G014200 [Prunus persica]